MSSSCARDRVVYLFAWFQIRQRSLLFTSARASLVITVNNITLQGHCLLLLTAAVSLLPLLLLLQVISTLRGHDDKVRVVLNKSDQVDQQQLMRVYGALMWSLGKVFKTPEVCRVSTQNC